MKTNNKVNRIERRLKEYNNRYPKNQYKIVYRNNDDTGTIVRESGRRPHKVKNMVICS